MGKRHNESEYWNSGILVGLDISNLAFEPKEEYFCYEIKVSPVSEVHLTVTAFPASCQPLFEYFQVYPMSLGQRLSPFE